jgi:hypothetical protein
MSRSTWTILRDMKLLSGGGMLLALALVLVPGCKKDEGQTCFDAADCAEGLACMGDAVSRCEKCEGVDACRVDGKCTAKEGVCIAASNDDCQKGWICKGKGGCTAKEGACTVGGDADCKQAEACAKDGYCKAKGNNCIKDKKKEADKPKEEPKEEEKPEK